MDKFHLGDYKPYLWKGVNKWGVSTKGVIVAKTYEDAEAEARKLGVTIHYLKEKSFWLLPGGTTNKPKIIDVVFMMRQLATLIAAGVPLVQALEILSVGIEKVKFRALIMTVRDDITAGQTFAESLTPYPNLFNSLICGLINAGEQSGTLDSMVNEIANYLEHQEYLKNRIKKAMYYPLTILTISMSMMVAMLVFLVPKFEAIYASFNAKLPSFTMKVIGLSKFIREKWWLTIAIAVAIYYIFRYLNRNSKSFQYFRDAVSLRVIIFGKLFRKTIIARITSTLAVTIHAGIPLIDALTRVSQVSNNHYYEDAIIHTREQVAQGESISMALRSTLLFPPMVTQMIEIGEKSGELDKMLSKVGEYYRDQVNTTVEGLTTMIEPIMIVLVGFLVGIFVFAMYLPIFNLGMAIK